MSNLAISGRFGTVAIRQGEKERLDWVWQAGILLEASMLKRKRYTFWINEVQAEALKRLKERDGTSEGESVRLALNAYLRKQGVLQAERSQVGARKRS
jgi:hypothetical protein